MSLIFVPRALRLLEQRRPDQALIVTAVSNYGLPNEELTVEWTPISIAAHDRDMVYVESRCGAPIYIHRRIAAYLQWNTICVDVWSFAWWKCFVVHNAGAVWNAVVCWERAHPGLKGRVAKPASPLAAA